MICFHNIVNQTQKYTGHFKCHRTLYRTNFDPLLASSLGCDYIIPVFNSIDFQASCATLGRLDTCSMAAFNWVKIYTGYGSEILELSLDIPADPGGGEVLPDPDHSQRNEGLHSSGSGYTYICRSWHDKLDIL